MSGPFITSSQPIPTILVMKQYEWCTGARFAYELLQNQCVNCNIVHWLGVVWCTRCTYPNHRANVINDLLQFHQIWMTFSSIPFGLAQFAVREPKYIFPAAIDLTVSVFYIVVLWSWTRPMWTNRVILAKTYYIVIPNNISSKNVVVPRGGFFFYLCAPELK